MGPPLVGFAWLDLGRGCLPLPRPRWLCCNRLSRTLVVRGRTPLLAHSATPIKQPVIYTDLAGRLRMTGGRWDLSFLRICQKTTSNSEGRNQSARQFVPLTSTKDSSRPDSYHVAKHDDSFGKRCPHTDPKSKLLLSHRIGSSIRTTARHLAIRDSRIACRAQQSMRLHERPSCAISSTVDLEVKICS